MNIPCSRIPNFYREIDRQKKDTKKEIRGLSQKYPTCIYIFAPKCSSDLYRAGTSTVGPYELIGWSPTLVGRIVYTQCVFVYSVFFTFVGFVSS